MPTKLTDSGSFSPALATLHNELTVARRKANDLEAELKARYGLPGLSFKVVPKLGAIVHVASKGAFGKIESDSAVTLVSKSGSTRSFNHGVSHDVHVI